MGTPLMDRKTFLDQGIERDVACDLCEMILTCQYKASRIGSHLHICRGVYCDGCLTDYLEVNNTCPIHPDVVLFHLAREPEFVSGKRKVAKRLDQVEDYIEASKFVTQLWHATKRLYDYEQIFDSDIKEKINETLEFIGECYNYESGLLIQDEQMNAVMDVAKEMIKVHFKAQGKVRFDEAATPQYWLPKMDKAVGWNQPIGFGMQ